MSSYKSTHIFWNYMLLGPHRTSIVICNNLTHSSSNPLDWMSIERSMDEYWTKYGAGIGRVQFGPFGHCIGWHGSKGI